MHSTIFNCRKLLLSASVLLLSASLSYAENSEILGTVSIRADEWYPFNGEPDNKNPGYMIEIAQYAFKKHNYAVDYKILPWERSLEEVAIGKIDCVVGTHVTEAPDFVFHKYSLGRDVVGFYGLQTEPEFVFENEQSLNGKSIAVIGGYGYGTEIDNYVNKYKNTPLVHISKGDDALDRNIQMLLSHRVDILIESQAVFENKLIATKGAELIKKVSSDASDLEDLFIACSPKNEKSKDYVKWIDEAILELRSSGKFADYLNRYGLKDWQ